jgi:hypothetical protein
VPPLLQRVAAPRAAAVCALATCVVAACIYYKTPTTRAVPVPRAPDSIAVTTPVKAHLLDGTTIVFHDGVEIAHDTLYGSGIHWDLALNVQTPVQGVPVDSVLGMETYGDNVDATKTGLAIAVPLALVAGIVIYCNSSPKACFGSCPTFYSDSAGRPVLEAEGFSYSIAPLFEARDVDRLRAAADADGAVRLEVRNEALETHYINALELLEVRHASDEWVVPDQHDRPLALRDFASATSAVDRVGRDVRATLATRDDDVFHSDPRAIDHATQRDLNDYIDLTLPVRPGSDSAALVFRMRNSLLNTVLLYDVMMAPAALKTLEWQASTLERVGPAAALGRWYVEHLGMRIAVRDHGAFRDVARISDTGPIAWKDVAVVVPVPATDSLRVRLSFVADDWRIDQVRVARAFRHAAAGAIAPDAVFDRNGQRDTAALAALVAADEHYLRTQPTERFTVRFPAGRALSDSARTFLLASQGYYIEWVRGRWLKHAATATPFTPTDTTLLTALRLWRANQPQLERRFAATRIPVR